jgi:hypothetical protein
MSDKLISMVKKLSDVTKVSEEVIVYNIKKSLSLGIAIEEDFVKIINKIID